MAYTLKLHSSPKGKEEIDALTGARRDQFIAAAKGEMEGATCKVPSDYFKYLAKENDGEIADQYAELWIAVKEGKDKPLYDLWYFPEGENGLVFEAGTARKAGVEIVDGSFEASDSSKKAEKLAEELQDSFDDRDVAGDDEDEDDEDEDEDDEDEDEDDEDEDEDDEDDEDEDD
jgi:hypothetical protein